MLVLSRKANESIKIDSNIEISILEIKKDSVKIAIKAPENIKILRSEIYDIIKEENKKSILQDKNNIHKIKNLFDYFNK
ncbi:MULTISPECIES: carbon storage regulator CsrA [Borrelia]|uniref:Translational regulator CsrA n=4 Tax=Borrelia TaxID=138 RepID=CSRA_BORHD|nr:MULTISPECIES: carbon storage regulator CsrA [Borrelia]B2RZP5.1 RecName: Full=Translational regulator CsrA [Borrelia hermsii DAH]AAX16701.1 carbon storage regulator [Borrelia hermsii DAH]AHH03144.1 Carbon storage regulator [Borrelia nietonii YOR]AHH12198.1 Carbon storage regulator [Borrelia hermsii YBT]AHH13681.1 Carbon storage regulator [Borrelia hermsii MTW]AJW73003.1 carbon storage regulator [Borrelia hermsii CC1]